MAIKQVFISTILSCKFLMPNGKELSFVNGEFYTDIDGEIALLTAEIKAGHPHIYVDAAKKTIDTDRMDPIEEIRRKAVEDYKASMAAATDKSNNFGTSEPGKLNIASSATVGAAAINSDSSASNAVLTPVPAAAAAATVTSKKG